MIIHMKSSHNKNDLDKIKNRIEELGCNAHIILGSEITTVSVLGETTKLSVKEFETYDGVEFVTRVSKPFKLCSIEGKQDGQKQTVIDVKGVKIGGGHFVSMAGPCAIESWERTLEIAKSVKASGAQFLRGGAFKPRSSPYSFQGLGEEGLQFMQKAGAETGLLTISEAMDSEGLRLCMEYVDVIQIGARNMQNFSFLKELGKVDKPILLKRGMSATIEEWLMSAEYILSGGNSKVILCERGIRSFDKQYSRNVLDLNVVPILKELTHLPVIIDPSHGTGHRHLVAPMAKASLACGADGIIVEVHNEPQKAMSDGPQALLPEDFEKLSGALDKTATNVAITSNCHKALKSFKTS